MSEKIPSLGIAKCCLICKNYGTTKKAYVSDPKICRKFDEEVEPTDTCDFWEADEE